MGGSLLDINQSITASEIEIREQFSYCINIKNISDCNFFNLIYSEKFNRNIRIIGVNIDGEKVKYTVNENNTLTVYFDKINLKEKKVIYVIIEALDYIDKEEFNKSGILLGKINVNNTVQEINEYINPIEINITNPKIVLTMISNFHEVIQGDVIEVVLLAENMGNVEIENILITDILENELEFIKDSIEINSTQYKNEDVVNGFNIGSLSIGELKSIKYKMKVVGTQSKKTIINKAIGRFTYKDRNRELSKKGTVISNIEKILVQIDDIDIKIQIKEEEISLNSEVDYKISIANIGTLNLYNLTLKKKEFGNFLLVEKSLFLNNILLEQKNFEYGILLGDLPINSKLELNFKLKYIGGVDKAFVENIFVLEKDYKLKDGYLFKGKSIEKKVKHSTNISSFKSLILDGEIFLKEFNQPIKEINKLKCGIEILNDYLIDTTEGKSVDNQIETGKKIIINGKIKSDIEYTILGNKGEVHFVNDIQRFSSYIVVPKNVTTKYKIIVTGKIDEVCYKILTPKRVRTTVSIILVAKVIAN